jgi:predicted site-specific integrase-resolvase
LLTRPVGRPSYKPVVRFKSFLYQAASWTIARRVVAKVEFHCGELFPRVGFIVTNLGTSSRAVVRFYNKRGTAEQWIKEGKQAVKMMRLSCHRFCANDTRKSSEEGLEQDFNSLQAQREACEAFIKSQASEGWKLIKTAYDDGGMSGGTMERPALQRLLADIGEGLVDVVVVYKVDRLTRSLADFAKMVEMFESACNSTADLNARFPARQRASTAIRATARGRQDSYEHDEAGPTRDPSLHQRTLCRSGIRGGCALFEADRGH